MRLSIPVEVREGDGMTVPHRGTVWTSDGSQAAAYATAYTLPKLREAVTANVTEALDEITRRRQNPERLALGCGDGTVLLVEYNGHGWQYAILRAGVRAGSTSGLKSYDDARTYATEHAQQCYGGVTWTTAL